jgi:hexokinase
MQGAVLDPRSRIGLILGTGCNACYLERADKVYHWESERHGEKEVCVKYSIKNILHFHL